MSSAPEPGVAHLDGRGWTPIDDREAGPVRVPVSGLLGVWATDGEFRLAGGCYPDGSLATTLDGAPETDPNRFRTDLVDLVRATR